MSMGVEVVKADQLDAVTPPVKCLLADQLRLLVAHSDCQ